MTEVVFGSGGNVASQLIPDGNLTWTHTANPFNITRRESQYAKELSCLSNDRDVMTACCHSMDGHFLNSKGNFTADVENDRNWLHWCQLIRTDNEGEAYNAGYGQAGEMVDRWEACFEANANARRKAEFYEDLTVNSSVWKCEYPSNRVTGAWRSRPRGYGGGQGGALGSKLGGVGLAFAVVATLAASAVTQIA